jgi:ABC-2 type transport system permease protein
MSSTWTVVKFTFKNRFRSKPFLIASILFAVVISIIINLPSIIAAFSSDKPTHIGILYSTTDIPSKLEQYYSLQEKPKLKISEIPNAGSVTANEKAANEQLNNKEIKGYIQLTDDSAAGFPKVSYKSTDTIDPAVQNELLGILKQIKIELVAKDSGLSEQQKTQLFAPVAFDNPLITLKDGENSTGKTDSQKILASALVYVLLTLLFMSTQIYGQFIATEVTAEKSSRVMELLISSVSPLKQMFGKVLGMFLLALTQISLVIAVAIFNINLPNNKDFLIQNHLQISDIPLSLIVYFIVFFILGFFLFAMLFAAMGSLVSRTEDLAQGIMPVSLLMIGGFYIGLFGIHSASSAFITAMSFVPFFTPMIMFLRIGMTDLAFWQVIVGIVELLLTILVIGWFSAKIYRVGVLMYGKKPSFKEVVKAMRAYKV